MVMNTFQIALVAATSGLAVASPIGLTESPSLQLESGAGFDVPVTVAVDVSGMRFNDGFGSALNDVLRASIGPAFIIVGVGWDVNLTTVGSSWASEATMVIEDEMSIRVGVGIDGPVENMNFSSDGFVNLAEIGIDPIFPRFVGGDYIIDIEFAESFIDNDGTGDAFFEANSFLYFTRTIPAPGSMATVGALCLFAGRRRR
jgi:hypothetical protein